MNQADEFGLRPCLGGQAHGDGDQEVGAEGEDGPPEVLRPVAGVVVEHGKPSAVNAGQRLDGQREAVVQHGRGGAGDEAGKRPVPRRPLPEHAQQEGGEERGIDEGEDQLQRVHDVVEVAGRVGGGDRQQDAANGRPSAHRHAVAVAGALAKVGLVEVVGEDSVEGGDVARHAAHEAGQQRGQAEAEKTGGKDVEQQVGRGHVVVEQGLSAGGEHGLAGDGVDLGRNQAAAFFHVVRDDRGVAHDHAVDVAFDRGGVGRGQADGQQAGQNHQERQEDHRHRGNERRTPRRLHILRGHGRLDHTKVGAPIA